jgi:hypothetical protein
MYINIPLKIISGSKLAEVELDEVEILNSQSSA